MLEILLNPDFDNDMQALESDALRLITEVLIERIATGEHVIKKALGKVKGIGDLRGCWAIKFDLLGYPNRFRLVIQCLPHDFAPTELLLIAVGPRFDGQVYKWAGARMQQGEV